MLFSLSHKNISWCQGKSEDGTDTADEANPSSNKRTSRSFIGSFSKRKVGLSMRGSKHLNITVELCSLIIIIEESVVEIIQQYCHCVKSVITFHSLISWSYYTAFLKHTGSFDFFSDWVLPSQIIFQSLLHTKKSVPIISGLCWVYTVTSRSAEKGVQTKEDVQLWRHRHRPREYK